MCGHEQDGAGVPDLKPCPNCGALGWVYPCSECRLALEMGTCDTCGAAYDLASRDGRCGNCGECAEHCTHEISLLE